MSTELLDWVYAYLERDEDIIVPIRKMWNEWSAAHGGPPLAEFTAIVLADERFEEMPGVDHDQDLDWLDPDERVEWIQHQEEMGFYSGPRVKLKSREITLDHIVRMMKKHNDRMEAALHGARATLPPDATEEDEDQVVEILKMARELRRRLREAGLEPDEEEPDEEWDA